MALPNSRILIHQVLSGCQGQATDIEIHAHEGSEGVPFVPRPHAVRAEGAGA
jgi:hypothetical protein